MSASAATSAAPAKPESVSLKVRASPSDAKIYLDNILLGAGSFEGRVPYSDAPRVLRVEAEGHQSKEESLTPTADLVTSFSLDKLDSDGPAASASAPSVSGPFKPSGPRPRPTGTGRGIDSESPYKLP